MQQATIQPGSQALLPFTVRPAKEPEHRDLYDALTAYAASVTNVADTEALGVDASEAIRQCLAAGISAAISAFTSEENDIMQPLPLPAGM